MHLKYHASLDGLRGFAISVVMLYHALWTPITGGFLGVDLFFVLSGYLITSGLIKEYRQQQKINFKYFYMRRGLRLLPALVVLLFSTLLYIWVTAPEQFEASLKEAGVAFFYMSNWARAYHLYPLAWFGHTWSLSIEEQFYFLWPILFVAMMTFFKTEFKVKKVLLVVLLLFFVERFTLTFLNSSVHRLYNAFDTRAEALLLGCFLSFVISDKRKFPNWLAWFSLFGLLILFFTLNWKNPGTYYYGLTLAAIASALLTAELVQGEGSNLKTIFEWKPLCYLGKISYGLYLWHFVIYNICKKSGFSNLEILFYGGPITFVIATISYFVIERPFLRFKKHFA